MQAVTLRADVTQEPVKDIANSFYAWLRESVDGGGEQLNSPTPHEAAPPPSTTPEDISYFTRPEPNCQHEWTDAPRQGWRVCTKCRRAVPEGEAK
jgi:hypothetical protein